jgi:hypothetical protein
MEERSAKYPISLPMRNKLVNHLKRVLPSHWLKHRIFQEYEYIFRRRGTLFSLMDSGYFAWTTLTVFFNSATLIVLPIYQ